MTKNNHFFYLYIHPQFATPNMVIRGTSIQMDGMMCELNLELGVTME